MRFLIANVFGGRLLAIASAAVLLVGLTACGGNNDDTSSESSTASSESSVLSSSSSSMVSSSVSSSAQSSLSSSSSSSSEPSSTFDQAAYTQADATRGGQLYAKFWMASGFSISSSQLTSPSEVDYIDDNAAFFQCSHCHGWDLLGRDGASGNHAPSSTQPNIADISLAALSEMLSPQALFDAIKEGYARRDLYEDLSNYDPQSNSIEGDRMPNFSQIFSDTQVLDIVKFLKEKAIDTSALYDVSFSGDYPNRVPSFSNIGKDGNAANGQQIYLDNCSVCHGSDGTAIALADSDETVGSIVRSNPHIAQHKVRFGELGSIMGPVLESASTDDLRDLLKALADAQNFPAANQPVNGAQLFVDNCQQCHNGNDIGTGPLDITGASASTIRSAIASIPQMNEFSSLTNDEIDAIAAAIFREKPAGQVLFEGYCISCHTGNGVGDGGTDKTGKTAAEIFWALDNIGRMTTLNISDADVQTIANWLQQ